MNTNNTTEERVKALEERVLQLENVIKSNSFDIPNANSKQKSPKEFLLEKNPKDDLQRTLYLGYYLEKYQGMESFGVDELREEFRSARTPVPKNLNDKVNKNISKGFFMEVEKKEGKKAWVLTATGEKNVGEENEPIKHTFN